MRINKFSQPEILKLLLKGGGFLARSEMEAAVFSAYREEFGWEERFDEAIEGKGRTRAQNELHHARRLLVMQGLLQASSDKDGRAFRLNCTAGDAALYLRKNFSNDVGALVGNYLQASNAVYIMADRRHLEWIKIGCGIGDCKQRESEARRWTRFRAELVHVVPVGPERGWRVEQRTHQILADKRCKSKSEWFRCGVEIAVDAIHQANAEV